jgi:hypothetical protein
MVGQLNGRRHLRRIMCTQKNDTEMNPTEIGWEVWTGFVWLRIGICDGVFECSNVQPHAFLIPVLDRDERWSSGSGRLDSETGTHGAHSIRQ